MPSMMTRVRQPLRELELTPDLPPSIRSQSSQNLTGQVVRTESHYFAFGGNADIYKGQWAKIGSGWVEVAVKVLKGCEKSRVRTTQRLLREMTIWSAVQHRNITPFLGISLDFDRLFTPCLVSPYYRHGDIINYLNNHPNANKLALVSQVTLALSYLHGLRIVHGDVKGNNILINDLGEASIIDFGLSRILQASGFTTQTMSGSLRYMAPELIYIAIHDPTNDESVPLVTLQTDLWATAITITEIFTESIPFSHIRNDAGVIFFVMNGGRPIRELCLQIDDEIWAMLETCWNENPDERPSMATLSRFFT